jgi:hypothetical protein
VASRTFKLAIELLKEICEITSAIPRAKLETFFLEWEERLQRNLDINEAYVD